MKKRIKEFLMGRAFLVILAIATLIGITIAGIAFKQSPLRILPLYISLGVMLLNSRANRFGVLVGSLNSLLYAYVYFYYKLYGSFLSALLVSFPIQLVTFILWSKRSYKSSTVFRRLGKKRSMLALCGSLIAYTVCVLIQMQTDARFVFIDSAILISGIVIPMLTMFAFKEYSFVQLFTNLLSPLLYILMLKENPEQLTYLIYSVYGYACIAIQYFNVKRLYAEQNAERAMPEMQQPSEDIPEPIAADEL